MSKGNEAGKQLVNILLFGSPEGGMTRRHGIFLGGMALFFLSLHLSTMALREYRSIEQIYHEAKQEKLAEDMRPEFEERKRMHFENLK